MTPCLRMLVMAIAAIGPLLPAAAVSQGLSSDDRTTIRSTISNQIEAFRRDDATVAYDYAAPGIRSLFPTAERFMDMIRKQYRPVYRPRSVTFGEIVETADGILQKVFLTGPDGKNWIAAYQAERQDDGAWRITGCTLIADESPGI